MRMSRVAAVALLSLASACRADGPPAPRIGEPATEYVAATLEGDSVSLASQRGHVVLLNMWATWCAPCRAETPYLESVYEQHRDEGLRVVGISLDTGDAADQVAAFVAEYGVKYTILHDPQMRGMDLYQLLGLPASFLIDREGVLRWMRYGPIQEGDREFLQALSDLLS
jgi:cytochrome c biogenesis protein CcmG, thiol:disulfide interchange protein DsbE